MKDDFKREPFWPKGSLLEEKDIFSEVAERRGTSLFLGKYSLTEVSAVLGKKNFFKEARKRHLWPIVFDLDSTAYPLQRFQIFYRDKKAENLVVDLKIREGMFYPREKGISDLSLSELKCLVFEWLTLQNPLLGFSEKRPALPGQQHPGLGMSKKVLDIFIYLGRLTQKECLLAFPMYFHNAILFSRYFRFFNAEKEAEVLAIRKSFSQIPLKQLAWIIHWNCLRGKNNEIYEWKAEEQAYPLTKALKDYFESRKFKEKIKKSMKKFHFSIDWRCYEKMKEKAQD